MLFLRVELGSIEIEIALESLNHFSGGLLE